MFPVLMLMNNGRYFDKGEVCAADGNDYDGMYGGGVTICDEIIAIPDSTEAACVV